MSDEWISVKKRLPDYNIKVLAYDGNQQFVAHRFKLDNNEEYFLPVFEPKNCETNDITHWMPLPEPPTF
jgi:hypothetical protein